MLLNFEDDVFRRRHGGPPQVQRKWNFADPRQSRERRRTIEDEGMLDDGIDVAESRGGGSMSL
jgi:hypothetical protein